MVWGVVKNVARDCNHVSGYCKDGCKSGWQGLDCLEVPKLAVADKNWKSEFSGFLSAFCIVLIINVALIAYIVINRFRNRSVKLSTMRQSSSFQNIKEPGTSNVYINESNISDYQELREFNKAETYDALEFMPKK